MRSRAGLNGWILLWFLIEKWCRPAGATARSTATPCHTFTLDQPTILVLGNEGTGLRKNVELACTELVRIDASDSPLPAGIDSLNVSVASGILVHHFLTSRKQSNAATWGWMVANPWLAPHDTQTLSTAEKKRRCGSRCEHTESVDRIVLLIKTIDLAKSDLPGTPHPKPPWASVIHWQAWRSCLSLMIKTFRWTPLPEDVMLRYYPRDVADTWHWSKWSSQCRQFVPQWNQIDFLVPLNPSFYFSFT